MSRPDRSAFIVAGFLAVDAGIALACDAPIVAAALGVMAAGALALFWRAPLEEDIPDYVPDQWVQEHRR